MKKILSVILFTVIILAMGVNSFAAGSAGISFNTSGPDEKGNVVVEVVLSGEGEPAMLQFCVAYDSEKLECVSATAGSVFSGNLAPIINVTEGKIFFVWDSLNPLKESGTLLKITFSTKAAGSASVWIDDSEEIFIANEDFEDIGVIGGKAEIGSSESSGSESSGNTETSSSEKTESSASPESSSEQEKSESSEVPDTSESSSEQSNSEQENGYSSGIEIDKTQITVNVGEETVIGIEGTDKELFWYSSNEDIVRVEDGKIIPVAPGTATVTVVTEDGSGEAACVVRVLAEGEKSSSGEETGGNVIEVTSPREEKEDSVPAWAWIIIALLGIGAVCLFVLLAKKAGNLKGKE